MEKKVGQVGQVGQGYLQEILAMKMDEKNIFDEVLKVNSAINEMINNDVEVYGFIVGIVDKYKKDKSDLLDIVKEVMSFNDTLIHEIYDLQKENTYFRQKLEDNDNKFCEACQINFDEEV